MTRRFRSTRKFDKQFKQLNSKTLKQAQKAIELFMSDPTHPSLRYKKIQGTDNSMRSVSICRYVLLLK